MSAMTQTYEMTCKDLITVSKYQIDQINIANKFKMPSILSELFGSLHSAPFLRGNVRGDWARLSQPILSSEEAAREVGWLYKNTNVEQRQLIAGVDIQAMAHPWDSPAHRQHVMDTRSVLGKTRISRMRSQYSPVSDTSKL
jgi:hypothetical protein